VIVGTALDPRADRRDDAIFKETLFSRDDQIFQSLAAGIDAGQHEGGGKSLEVRRFGFNLDHGGVGGGLKVLVDDVQQNMGTQGHGQGYLGSLKTLTPELVAEVEILNGPFSAQYGDFSGLGVVHILLKESLPDLVTARLQAGSFDSLRGFVGVSPRFENADSFLAYETSRTNGPFIQALDYRRDNVTGNYTLRLSDREALGVKLNAGRNDFTSSGQIPLDEVAASRLDRFGFIDPDGGGRVRSGTLAAYYRRQVGARDMLKADAFVSRSLFDLYSNFTFFLNDEVGGDGIQQHDSRLQEGANVQYLHGHTLFGRPALLMAGGNLHANQITVGLFPGVRRTTTGLATLAHADVTNGAGYVQESFELLGGRLHVEAGLRHDHFRFSVDDRLDVSRSGDQEASRVQPKAGLAIAPWAGVPLALHVNYGRGISSQDARGVVRDPSGPKIATTDFYQVGLSSNGKRASFTADVFLIDRSNEQVYIPDDGSIELAGPSRAYGIEAKASVRISSHLAFSGGMTRVMNAFYRGTSPRLYVDSAPHVVASAGLTLSEWRGFSGSLRHRHTSGYRLDGSDSTIRASGLDILDLSLDRRLADHAALYLSVDNLLNKRYYETQNYFESRLAPGDPIVARIHATPGYSRTLNVGVSFRLGARK
jgi:outer membrane receptor protein involved in Fe transport